MRTTLTLDKDVAVALERLRKARKASLKAVVNEALRQGLARMAAPPRHRAGRSAHARFPSGAA